MTPSDDQILAAARDLPTLASIEYDQNGPSQWRTDDNGIIALYRTAFAAGMEAAAVICGEQKWRFEASPERAAMDCADAIREAKP